MKAKLCDAQSKLTTYLKLTIFVNKKRITFISVARSDFGRLYPTIEAVKNASNFELQLIVSGNHNSEKYGGSIEEIKSKGLDIDLQIPITKKDLADISVEITSGLNKWFSEVKADYFVILGDRYEMLAAAQSAFLNNVPIVHIGGGYETAGAIDDRIRHAITQLSSYHFTATDKCRDRVMALLGNDKGVFLSGAPDLEILKRIEPLTKKAFFDACGLSIDKPFVLVTIHPETLLSLEENERNLKVFGSFLNDIEEQVLITAPCADPGSEKVFEMIEDLQNSSSGVCYIKSLGMKKYASAMKYAEMMIGNSSSGIIESATMGIPVLDVGCRQKGREVNNNVLNSCFDIAELQEKYLTLKSEYFKKICSEIDNIYGGEDFSGVFCEVLNSLK